MAIELAARINVPGETLVEVYVETLTGLVVRVRQHHRVARNFRVRLTGALGERTIDAVLTDRDLDLSLLGMALGNCQIDVTPVPVRSR